MVFRRVVLLSVVLARLSVGGCIERYLEGRIDNAVSWHVFWFGPSGGTTAIPRSEECLIIRSEIETAVFLKQVRLKIRFIDGKSSDGPIVLVRAASGDLEADAREYRQFLSRASNLPKEIKTLAECRLELTHSAITEPASQLVAREDDRYLLTARIFLEREMEDARCPCEVWVPYFDSSDPRAFALVRDRDNKKYFLAFYWSETQNTVIRVEAPHYMPEEPSVQHLEDQILKKSRLHFFSKP